MEYITQKKFMLPEFTAVAAGQFDALHKGHIALINAMIKRAYESGLKTAVFSFYPAPFEVLEQKENKEQKRFYTYTSAEKRLILSSFGIDYFIEYPFDNEFSETPAIGFISEFLADRMKCKLIIAGESYRFGKNREGGLQTLEEQSKQYGFEVQKAANVLLNGEIISSRAVRSALSQGDFNKAKALTGRAYFISGVVEEGKKLGAKLSFPTVNVSVPVCKQRPPNGVYVTLCKTQTGTLLPSVTNLGASPSFAGKGSSCETHILDFNGELYGQTVFVAFYEFIRAPISFNTAAELIAQIKRDSNYAHAWWKNNAREDFL